MSQKNWGIWVKTDIRVLRKKQSAPILEDFYNWAVNTRAKVLPKSATGTAITYFLNEYPLMKNYIDNPEADIDNNFCERTIRPMTIGRKNYLFAGSENGAIRAAIIYSLILTCRIHNIDPYHYFIKVFKLIAENPETELDMMLPDVINL